MMTGHIGLGSYTLEELSHTEVRDLDNRPPAELLPNLTRVSDMLYEVRKLFRFELTSAYRSPAVNARVGGRPNSQHCLGLAADIIPVIPYASTRLAALKLGVGRIRKDGLKFDQLIMEYERWIHISIPREKKDPRGQVLVIRRTEKGQIETAPWPDDPGATTACKDCGEESYGLALCVNCEGIARLNELEDWHQKEREYYESQEGDWMRRPE